MSTGPQEKVRCSRFEARSDDSLVANYILFPEFRFVESSQDTRLQAFSGPGVRLAANLFLAINTIRGLVQNGIGSVRPRSAFSIQPQGELK